MDRAGLRVSAAKGASQEIFLSSHLKNTQLKPVVEMPTEQELAKQLLGGELDAFAANRSACDGNSRARTETARAPG